jgi:hypothetical protein
VLGWGPVNMDADFQVQVVFPDGTDCKASYSGNCALPTTSLILEADTDGVSFINN